MPARYRRSSYARSRNSRRKLVWAEFDSATAPGAALHAQNIDVLSTYKSMVGEALAGVTVVRTHLTMSVSSTIAAGDSIKWGMLVTHVGQASPSFAVGGGSPNFVNPVDYPYAQWAFIDRLFARPNYNPMSSTNTVCYDIRSKRKLDEIQNTLILSIANEVGAASLTVAVFARVLLALP